jgi:hypothetical protein
MIDDILGINLGVVKVDNKECILKSGLYSYSQLRDLNKIYVKQVLDRFLLSCKINKPKNSLTKEEYLEFKFFLTR